MATAKLHSRTFSKWAAVPVIVAVAVAGLVGCSSTSAANSQGDVSGKLSILTPSADSVDKAFANLNAAFEKKYPKVKVEYTPVQNANYNSAESSRLTAGNVDIVVASPVEVPSYVPSASESNDSLAADAGTFLDLKGQPFLKNFTPSVLDAIRYKGHDYGVPTGLSYYTGIYYNKSIFDKYGLTVPTTWNEFVALCDKLKSAGVTPLGIGGKDSWPAGLTMLAAAQGVFPSVSDRQAFAKQLWSQSAKLTDPKAVKVLERVQTMYGYAEANFPGVGYDSVPALFGNGTVAMTPDGTWNEPTIGAAVGSKFEYGYFPIPTADKASDNKTLGGKVEIRLAVTKATKNKAAALAWMSFFSDPKNYATFVKESGYAPAEPNIPVSKFLDGLQPYTSTFTPGWDNAWTSNPKAGAAATFPFNYPAVSPMGTDDAQAAAQAAQKDWAAGF